MEPKKNEKIDLERKRPVFFGIGMTVALTLTIVAFEWKSPIDPIQIFDSDGPIIDETIFIPPTSITPLPPPPPKAVEIIEVKNEEEVPEDLPELDVDTDEHEEMEITIPEPTFTEESVEETPRNWAEVMPTYDGGMQNFYRVISKHIQYPARAKQMGIEGRVFIQFVVEKDGSLSNIKALRGIGAGCDEEAIRVMKLVEGFRPAKQGDVRVRLQMVVPIHFLLQ